MLNGRKLSRQGGPFSSFSLSELLLIHCLVTIDPYRRIRRWTWRSLQSSSSEVNHMLPKWSLFPERWMLWTCCPTTMTTSWLAWMFPRAYTACPFLRPIKILSHVLRVGPNHFFWCSKEYSFSESYTQMFSSLGSINNVLFLLRPHGKFLVLSENKEESRFLIGRELLILMGLPIHRMAGIDQTAEQVS